MSIAPIIIININISFPDLKSCLYVLFIGFVLKFYHGLKIIATVVDNRWQ